MSSLCATSAAVSATDFPSYSCAKIRSLLHPGATGKNESESDQFKPAHDHYTVQAFTITSGAEIACR